MSSCTLATTSRRPYRSTVRSRNSMTSSKFWSVSTCITGNGTGAGQNAFTARCNMTTESLPPENSIAGFSVVAATSRMMWTASASSMSRWLISYATVIVLSARLPARRGTTHRLGHCRCCCRQCLAAPSYFGARYGLAHVHGENQFLPSIAVVRRCGEQVGLVPAAGSQFRVDVHPFAEGRDHLADQ